MEKVLLTLLILISAFCAQAQNETVKLKGILTAKNGDAIPGCNVIIKGQFKSVSTGVCGEFEIDISDNFEGTLIFSCMVFRIWEIPIEKLKDKEKIIIVLADFDKFENGKCQTNYKNEKRIIIK